MESTTKNPPSQKQRCCQDANDNSDGENDPAAHDLIEDHSGSVGRPNCEAEGHSWKRHRHAPWSTAATALTDEAAGGCLNLSQKPLDGGFAVTFGETQEVFGRGIFCIQPHGPRHAYFIMFLPDVVQPPPIPSTSELPPEKSSCSDGAGSQNQSGS